MVYGIAPPSSASRARGVADPALEKWLRLGRRLVCRIKRFGLDRALSRGEDPSADPLLGQRAEQLLSARMRRGLAADLRDLVEQADHSPGLSAIVPVAPAVKSSRGSILAIADALERSGGRRTRRRDGPAHALRQHLAVLVRAADGAGARAQGSDGRARGLSVNVRQIPSRRSRPARAAPFSTAMHAFRLYGRDCDSCSAARIHSSGGTPDWPSSLR